VGFVWSAGLALGTGCAACVAGAVGVWVVGGCVVCLGAWRVMWGWIGSWTAQTSVKRGLAGNLGFTFKQFPACCCFAWREEGAN